MGGALRARHPHLVQKNRGARAFIPGTLFVERNGKKEELLPETSDLFFRKGVEGRILFHYASTGKVDALIDRRNNEDVVWRRVK